MKDSTTMIRAGFFVSLLAVLTACASQPSLYSWGQYENLVYNTYSEPGKVSPEMEIEQMEKDLQKAHSQDKPVHPGFHAHMGYLYYQVGKADAARREFETEKARFPESSVLMDQFLARLQRK